MTSPRAASSPTDGYVSARSRTASPEPSSSGSGRQDVSLAPLSSGDGNRRAIGVSSNIKRQFKDRRIYVNQRTGLPVRPPTSFGLYKHALRRTLRGDKIDFFGFNKQATENWSKMSEQDKEPYVQRSKELAEEYKRVEVRFLRRKLRQLQSQVKDYRQAASSSYYHSSRRR